MKTKLTLLLLIGAQLAFGQTKNRADEITGIWLTGSGNGKIEIAKNGNTYQGKIVWLKEPVDPKTKKPKTDSNNPNAENKNRPLMGLNTLWGFEFAGENTWENGYIYDPQNGKKYKCIITLKNKNTLTVRGYIGISLIGRDDTWTRSNL